MTDREGHVRIGAETERARGWAYAATITWPGGGRSEHRVTLSWADHELIAGGVYPPSRTVEAALNVLLDVGPAGPGSLPGRFDISTLRRMIDGFDDRVRGLL